MPHIPIPLTLVPQIARWLGVVGAGFPSPAQDYEESRIDLLDWLAPGRASSFVMRVDGWSMRDVGIHDGDLIVVDRGIDATPGATVVAAYQDGFVVRTLRREQGRPVLVGANAEMRTTAITLDETVEIFGCVRAIVRQVRT